MSHQLKNPLFVQNSQKDLGQLPGYAGYMTSIKSENLFGKTFGDTTRAVLQKNIQKGSNLEPDQIYKSLFTDSFQSPEVKNKQQKSKQEFYVEQTNYQTSLTFDQLKEISFK